MVDTPAEGGTESMMNPATIEGLPSFSASGAAFIPQAAAKPVEVAAAEPAAAPADAGAELVAAGARVYRKCKSCHQIGDGAQNRTGPHLNGLFVREMGSVDGFGYSRVFQSAQEEGRVWDDAELTAFLAQPKAYMNGTKMAFSGLKKAEDLDAVIAYIKSYEN